MQPSLDGLILALGDDSSPLLVGQSRNAVAPIVACFGHHARIGPEIVPLRCDGTEHERLVAGRIVGGGVNVEDRRISRTPGRVALERARQVDPPRVGAAPFVDRYLRPTSNMMLRVPHPGTSRPDPSGMVPSFRIVCCSTVRVPNHAPRGTGTFDDDSVGRNIEGISLGGRSTCCIDDLSVTVKGNEDAIARQFTA